MRRILIIDDAPVIRKITRRICEGLQFDVREVDSAISGINICRENLPDWVLIDALLPNQTAIAFVKELRALAGGAGPKVIFILMENDVGQIAKIMHAGADGYILKPFDRHDIMQKFNA